MTLVTLLSVKGSPGVTTLATLIGATWPTDRPVMVAECDPSGGDLATRFGLSSRSGWLTLATSARRGATDTAVAPHLQQLPGGLQVLIGAQAGDSSVPGESVHRAMVQALVRYSAEVDVVVDAGRLLPDLVGADGWLGASDVTCVVLRADAASVVQVRNRVDAVRQVCGGRACLIVVGRGAHRSPEIEKFIGLPVLGEIPDDVAAAAVASGEGGTERRLARSVLVSATRRLATSLSSTGTDRRPVPVSFAHMAQAQS